MGFPLTDVKLFNFYRRYKWNEVDFGIFQDTLINYPATLGAKAFGDAVLSGGNQNGSAALNVDFTEVFAINSLGNLLYAMAGTVAVNNSINSLIVIRPVNASTTPITRPTAPFDAVDLNTEQTAEVVSIDGTLGVYPAKQAGDVILFGVTAAGGVITVIDETQCELLGKSVELSRFNTHNKLVGNHRWCHYRTLALMAASLASGDRVRVVDSEALAATVVIAASNVNIEFDPNVAITAGAATTGITLSGSRTRLINGRMTGFTVAAIAITGNFNSIIGMLFATNTADVTDALATSQQVGVLSE